MQLPARTSRPVHSDTPRHSVTPQRTTRASSHSQPCPSRTSVTPQGTSHTATWSSSSNSTSVSSAEDDIISISDRELRQSGSSSASTSSSSESEVPDDTAGEREKWVSKNRMITWAPTKDKILWYTPAACLPEGPTAYALQRICDIESCMDLFVTEDIIQRVLLYTNLHGQRTDGNGWGGITMTELRAFFGLLILTGVYRSRDECTKSLWSEETGRAIFPATMACKRFEKIATMIRFDDKLSRSTQLKESKVAAIWPVWEKWAPQLQMMYNPGVDICVDEQLVPFKGSCCFSQYTPSNPARYGMKVWVACDARTSYAWKMSLYTGKQDGACLEAKQGTKVVLELMEGLKGHTVTCNNFFTSYGLGEELLRRGIAMVGTLKSNKPELPPKLLEVRQRAIHSSVFAFSRTHTAVSYVPKRGKNVVLLSTKHHEPAISDELHRKPIIIMDYNRNKDGVNNLDKVVKTYSCRRKTQSWPLKLFCNILDVSAYNAFVLWMCVNPLWKEEATHKRRLFLEQLGRAMVSPLMQQRQRLPRNPSAISIVNAARECKPLESNGLAAMTGQRRQCRFCSKRVRNTCCRCGQYICRAHTSILCRACSLADLD